MDGSPYGDLERRCELWLVNSCNFTTGAGLEAVAESGLESPRAPGYCSSQQRSPFVLAGLDAISNFNIADLFLQRARKKDEGIRTEGEQRPKWRPRMRMETLVMWCACSRKMIGVPNLQAL